MIDLPPEARQALALERGESLANAWKARHHKGAATSALAGFPEGMEGILVLTSSRLVFLQEGGRMAKSYRTIPPLTWRLEALAPATLQESRGLMGSASWVLVQGEYFTVGGGGTQEVRRAHWSIEQARSTAQRPAPATPTALPPAPAPAVPAPSPPSIPTSAVPPSPVATAAPTPVAAAPAVAAQPPAPPEPPRAPAPGVAPSVSPRSADRGLSRANLPIWPMVPMTVVETQDVDAFWSLVGSSGVDRSKLLVFCTESPAELSAAYGLAGATLWRISRTEGEGRVVPGDADRLGYLLEGHLDKETGRAVVVKGLDRIIEEAGFRAARRLLEVAREVAEKNRGAVIVHVDPVLMGTKEIHQLEDDCKVLRI